MQKTLLLELALILALASASGPSCAQSVTLYQHVVLGLESTCVVTYDGLKCYGLNKFGDLGTGDLLNYEASTAPIIDFGNSRKVVMLSSGVQFTRCAVFDDSSSLCWGDNSKGTLGQGTQNLGDNEFLNTVPMLNHGSGNIPVMVQTFYRTSCFIYSNGSSKCVGTNAFGEIGQNSLTAENDVSTIPPIPFNSGDVPVYVSLGVDSTCWLFSNGKSMCCGDGTFGELGTGLTPASTCHGKNAKSVAGQPYHDLGTGNKFIMLAGGLYYFCGIINNGDTKCWGRASLGVLENPNTNLPLCNNGQVICETRSIVNIPAIDFGGGAKAIYITIGQTVNCAILDNGKTK